MENKTQKKLVYGMLSVNSERFEMVTAKQRCIYLKYCCNDERMAKCRLQVYLFSEAVIHSQTTMGQISSAIFWRHLLKQISAFIDFWSVSGIHAKAESYSRQRQKMCPFKFACQNVSYLACANSINTHQQTAPVNEEVWSQNVLYYIKRI